MTRTIRPIATLALLVGIVACAADHSPTGTSDPTPLRGLRQAGATDSSGTPVPSGTGTGNPVPGPDTTSGNPTQPADNTPGYVHGVVRASDLVQGPDTLVSSVRIANVRVAAYPVTDWSSTAPQPHTGSLAAEVFTDSNGEFTLPTLAAGHYVVTFTPPQDSKYQGVWVTTTISGSSKDYPWWVTLPNK